MCWDSAGSSRVREQAGVIPGPGYVSAFVMIFPGMAKVMNVAASVINKGTISWFPSCRPEGFIVFLNLYLFPQVWEVMFSRIHLVHSKAWQ